MTHIVVLVRDTRVKYSRRTLLHARRIAEEREAELTVLHVDPSYAPRSTTPADLQDAVEAAVGPLPRARYVTASGSLPEETLVEEVTAENPDVVVLGRSRSRVHRLFRRLLSGAPNVETYLRDRVECEIVTTPANPT